MNPQDRHGKVDILLRADALARLFSDSTTLGSRPSTPLFLFYFYFIYIRDDDDVSSQAFTVLVQRPRVLDRLMTAGHGLVTPYPPPGSGRSLA